MIILTLFRVPALFGAQTQICSKNPPTWQLYVHKDRCSGGDVQMGMG